MSTQSGRRRDPDDAYAAHLDRVYKRIDGLDGRVAKLERSMYIGIGGLGTVAVFNLISNLSQMAGQ